MQASHYFKSCAAAAAEVAAELIWPTRCAICGALGKVLCDTCRKELQYVDLWRACPRCGAPFGMHQCTECNGFSLQSLGRKKLPYHSCVSAVRFDESSASIVRIRKDEGERRLVTPMAFAMAAVVPPEWLLNVPSVTYIPSTASARRARGFCHARELAEEFARVMQLHCASLLRAGKAKDQRQLGRVQREQNMQGAFTCDLSKVPVQVILVDDVYTTGATAMAATDALLSAGVKRVDVAVYARV